MPKISQVATVNSNIEEEEEEVGEGSNGIFISSMPDYIRRSLNFQLI
jgi:hypothetical protein